MAERRILPARTNRGRRPQPSEQQQARDNAIYQQFFERATNQAKQETENKQNQRQKDQQQIINQAKLQFQHRQMYSFNRVSFPYSRGYHYFFELTSFPRLEGSPTYAFDQDNVFNSTYSQQSKIIRDGLTVGELINRHIFGLPFVQNLPLQPTNDKNICHGYLFQNQDRKFHLDKNIYELSQIFKNFQKLQQSGKIRRFSCLHKDIDLSAIFQQDLTTEQRKAVLSKKIKILCERKQGMKNYVLLEDKNFFYHSLNQKLHDEIEQKKNQLTYKFIMNEIQYNWHLRQMLATVESSRKSQTLIKMFNYYQSDKSFLSSKAIDKILGKLNEKFYKKQDNSEFYEVSVPFMFLDFSNVNILFICEKILALKLAYQSEASFFMCKIFWKNTFNRELIINKEMKSLSRADYQKSVTAVVNQLQKWCKLQEKVKSTETTTRTPEADNLIKWEAFDNSSKCFQIFEVNNGLQITAREYIFLVLFYHLYLCVTQIYPFISNNQILCELMASQHFSKASNYITEAVGTARMGLLDEILRKLSEWIVRSEIEMDFKIKWVYNQQLSVAYFVKTSLQSEWETQKQDNEQQDNQNQQKDSVQKKTK